MKGYYNPYYGAGAFIAERAYNYFSGSRTQAITKNKSETSTIMAGSQFSRRKGVYGKRKRGFRLVKQVADSVTSPVIYRFQGVSRFGAGGGLFACSQRVHTDGNLIGMPLHLYDLTGMPMNGTPRAGFVAYWDNPLAGSPVSFQSIEGQPPNGAGALSPYWYPESMSTGLTDTKRANVFHRWTSIKMNLYGTYGLPTWYRIDLVKFDDDCCPGYASGTGVEMVSTFQYLTKPYIYSNLLNGDPEQKKEFKILRTWKYMIQPFGPDDQNTINSANTYSDRSPHFREVKLFIRHDMERKYDWKRLNDADHTDNPSFEQYNTGGNDSIAGNVYPSARLFLMIRAMSAYRRQVAVNVPNGFVQFPNPGLEPSDASPLYEPSYDIVIRNRFDVTP